MKIHNDKIIKLITKWSKTPFSKEDHYNSFPEKSAPFIEHVAPKALRFDIMNGEAWLKRDMQLIFSKPILWATIHGELIRLMGYDGAKAVLYKAGFVYGYEDAKNYLEYMAKSLDQPTPYFNDILYASMGWGVWHTIRFDVEKGQLQLRGWNRSDVATFVKMYGKLNQPGCFILQGFIAGICCTMYQRKIHIVEEKCVAKGDEYCEYYGFPEDEIGKANIADKLQLPLQNLRSIAGIQACAVVSPEGDILGSAFQSDIKVDSVSTMTATILSVAKRAGEELVQGKFNNVFIDSAEGNLALTNIGTEAVLVVLASKKIPIGNVMLKLKRTAQEILSKKLLSNPDSNSLEQDS